MLVRHVHFSENKQQPKTNVDGATQNPPPKNDGSGTTIGGDFTAKGMQDNISSSNQFASNQWLA